MADNNFGLGGILGAAAIIGLAAIGAAMDDSTPTVTPSMSHSYSVTPIPTPRYDRNTSYDPYSGRTTEQYPTQRRVDPRAYEIRPSFQPSAVEEWLRNNQNVIRRLRDDMGFIDDGQVVEIADRAIRLDTYESLLIYKTNGKLYVVDSALLKSDRNAKEQLRGFLRGSRMMKVSIITRRRYDWNYDWHYGASALTGAMVF